MVSAFMVGTWCGQNAAKQGSLGSRNFSASAVNGRSPCAFTLHGAADHLHNRRVHMQTFSRFARLRFRAHIHLAAIGIAIALLLAGCASLGNRPPRTANLTGDWKLDQALSEDPNGVMRQQRGSGHAGSSHHHRGGMGSGMGGMGGGMGMPSGGGMSRGGGYGGVGGYGGGGRGSHGGGSVLADFLSQPASLTIKQAPQELALAADGVSTTFVYGEKVVASVKGGTAERVSGWKGSDFIVKYNVTDGPVATRSYEVGDGGRQLIVTTDVEGGRAPKFEFRTVYERTPSG
jgi:hypothetical protein